MDEDFVGSWVKIFWDGDGKWYEGIVTDYKNSEHLVYYTDGDQKWHELSSLEESYEVLTTRPKLVKTTEGLELPWSPFLEDGNTGYLGVKRNAPQDFEAVIPGQRSRKSNIGKYKTALEAAIARAKKLAAVSSTSTSMVAVVRPQPATPATAPPLTPLRLQAQRDLVADLNGFESIVADHLDMENLKALQKRLHAIAGAVMHRIDELETQPDARSAGLNEPD